MSERRFQRIRGGFLPVCAILIVVGLSGCALIMPTKYELEKEAASAPLTDKETAEAAKWQHVLDRKERYRLFEAQLKLLEKEKNHDEIVRRISVYFRTYPVMKLGLLEASQRLRYGAIVMFYTDALLATGQVEEAGKALQHARSVIPMNPRIRLQTRRIVRIQRRDRLFGKFHPYFKKLPQINTKFIELMKGARRKNTVLPPTHDLFELENVRLGQWQSAFFERNYGTAMFWSSPFQRDRIPVVLVHGVNGSPKDFAKMIPRFESTRYQPTYFFYPTGMPLEDASKSLSEAIRRFVAVQRVERLAVVAHSMGGLVAKGVFDQMDVTRGLKPWKVLISISSPWTGFEAAENIDKLPDHPPALLDMSPKSRFLRRVHKTTIPKSIRFYMFFGAKGGDAAFSDGNDDSVIPVASVLESPVTDMALDVFGFYETHMSILGSERVFKRMRTILDAELGLAE